jgi:hypothetical protein
MASSAGLHAQTRWRRMSEGSPSRDGGPATRRGSVDVPPRAADAPTEPTPAAQARWRACSSPRPTARHPNGGRQSVARCAPASIDGLLELQQTPPTRLPGTPREVYRAVFARVVRVCALSGASCSGMVRRRSLTIRRPCPNPKGTSWTMVRSKPLATAVASAAWSAWASADRLVEVPALGEG